MTKTPGYQNKYKRVLITGYKGFVGSALTNMLTEAGYEVIGIDKGSYVDLFSLQSLDEVDVVVHLAALTNVRESHKQKDEYMRINVLGTAHMLRLCMDAGAKMVYMSSAAIDAPLTSPYALSKCLATDLVRQMQKATRAVILKPYNIYGINPPKDSLFYNHLNRPSLTVYGTGTDSRDFIHLGDVCRIIKASIDDDWQSDQPIAIGTGTATSVRQVTKWFAKYSKKKVLVKRPVGREIHKSVADITLLKKFYKGGFSTNLETDIKILIAAYNKT